MHGNSSAQFRKKEIQQITKWIFTFWHLFVICLMVVSRLYQLQELQILTRPWKLCDLKYRYNLLTSWCNVNVIKPVTVSPIRLFSCRFQLQLTLLSVIKRTEVKQYLKHQLIKIKILKYCENSVLHTLKHIKNKNKIREKKTCEIKVYIAQYFCKPSEACMSKHNKGM
jgi:hypothetical protein